LGERGLIETVRDKLAARTFIVPWQVEPPVGTASLNHLIGTVPG